MQATVLHKLHTRKRGRAALLFLVALLYFCSFVRLESFPDNDVLTTPTPDLLSEAPRSRHGGPEATRGSSLVPDSNLQSLELVEQAQRRTKQQAAISNSKDDKMAMIRDLSSDTVASNPEKLDGRGNEGILDGGANAPGDSCPYLAIRQKAGLYRNESLRWQG